MAGGVALGLKPGLLPKFVAPASGEYGPTYEDETSKRRS
jgi:hypothetical protein